MKYPSFIHKGSHIGVPAPSAGCKDDLKKNRFENAKKKLEELGYSLTLSKNLFHNEKGRSASKEERGKEFNEMIQNKNIDMILCATGGDFLLEMLPYVDFELLKENPKYVAGFSDPTGLLFPITTKYDIATIYGMNFSPLGAEPYSKSHMDFLNMMEGKVLEVESYDYYENEYREQVTGLEGYHLTEKVEWKSLDGKEVDIKGRILGGCFDIISDLMGTKYDGMKEFNERYQKDGIIWFFDNCEISMEETIRILWKMKEMNYFQYAKGIIFGRFGVNSTTYDYDVKSCLKDSVLNELGIPIIYDADISHKAQCMPIINGSMAHVTCKEGKGKIKFSLE